MRYLVVVEQGSDSWGAHVPDVPGVVAAAESREEVLEVIRDAIAFHIEGLRAEGEGIPVAASSAEVVEVDA